MSVSLEVFPHFCITDAIAARRTIAQELLSSPSAIDLADADFDYILNSSKWWDFRSDWLLEQYEFNLKSIDNKAVKAGK